MRGTREFWETIKDYGAFDSDLIWFAIDQNDNIIALAAIEFSPIDKSVFCSKDAYFKLAEYLAYLPCRGHYKDVSKQSLASNSEIFIRLASRGIDVYDWDFETLNYVLVLKSDKPLAQDLIDPIYLNNLCSLRTANNPVPRIVNESIDMRNFIKEKMVIKEDNRNWLEKKLNISRDKIVYDMVKDGIIEGSSFTSASPSL